MTLARPRAESSSIRSGGADGIVQGEGAQFTGTGLDLPGGPSATQAYGDLPNNLISVHDAVSIEGWVTLEGAGNWVRIFDFGSSDSDGVASTEITGPGDTNGGGNAGLDYLFLSASRGGNFDQQRVEVRDEDPAGGGINTFDSGRATAFPQQIHFVVTWEDTGDGSSTVNYWRDGVKMTDDGVANSTLADLNDDGVNDGPEVAAGENPKSAAATGPGLVHRYAFEAPAGEAPASTVITDLIGGANGTIVGNGAVLTGTQLTLPGGAGATDDAAYVDFPNGLISPLDHLTFEAWYTVRAVSAWSHFWNFGSTASGEVTAGNTGAEFAQDAFFFSHARGGNINNLRVGSRNLDPLALGGGTGPVDAVEENYDYDDLEAVVDQEYHIAATWTSDGKGGGQIVVYRDGLPAGSRTTTFTPRDLNDVNNWLGRSNWTGDEYFNGEVNEFRIYNGVMNAAAAAASFAAGPDAAPGLGGPVITDINYNKTSDTVTLKFKSSPGRTYKVEWSPDLVDFNNEIDADIASDGESTSYGPFANPSPGAAKLFFRVSE